MLLGQSNATFYNCNAYSEGEKRTNKLVVQKGEEKKEAGILHLKISLKTKCSVLILTAPWKLCHH